MRLIDANKLLQEKWKVETKDMWHMTEILDVVSAIDIEEQPTVKAIPVEWIKDYVGSGVSDDIFQRNKRFVLNMIRDWEKENGNI